MEKADAKFANSRLHLKEKTRPPNSARSAAPSTDFSSEGPSGGPASARSIPKDSDEAYSERAQAVLEEKKHAQEKRQANSVPKFSDDDPLKEQSKPKDPQFEDLDII